MRILTALTYYRPYVSGLTVYVERLARAWSAAGHQVTVLTSHYDARLPLREEAAGVEILRVPVAFRLSKGVVMPTIGRVAGHEVRKADVVSLHLPQFDAAGIAVRGRLHHVPVVLTYHCDLRLPAGPLSPAAMVAVDLANRVAGAAADVVVSYTEDYARHSAFLRRHAGKLRVIPPPVEVVEPTPEAAADFRRRLEGGRPTIGMAARLATEKGVEYLVEAMPAILERYPQARVLFAGQHENVLGEADYARRLAPLIASLGAHWIFLGVLDPQRMALFFRACDVTVLPSLNSTESFGLVQIESMLCGTPVVASDLPGVRQPVLSTGMGRVVPRRSAEALAAAILEVVEKGKTITVPPAVLRATYDPAAVAARYIELF
ncbi:MAG TPA: glycosyltransferase family 4 protein, partial [Anaerolineales bacterium]|nr:glycosyltransferase family 4 protein [Anaerolineales bacterium]